MISVFSQRLHWKLFFPFLGGLWLAIGIAIAYFVSHEHQRQQENLEAQLLNVNHSVIDAYKSGDDLQRTVDFVKLFTAQTTLAHLYLTVYDDNGTMVADNVATTISPYDADGNLNEDLIPIFESKGNMSINNVIFDGNKCMVSSMSSEDGKIKSFAALPYRDEVIASLGIDPMVWIVVILLGAISTALAYFGARALSRNIYALQRLAKAMASDSLPDGIIDQGQFSTDELGDVSQRLVTLYKDKLFAEREKIFHEHRVGINISHELNTPVGIIKGYLDTILSDDEMDESQRLKFLQRMQQNVDRLTTLIKDVGMIMCLQDGEYVIDRNRFDFRDMAQRLSEDVVSSRVLGDMEFVCDIPPRCLVYSHESLLTNVLLNLINNAVKHSGGSMISLRWLRCENDRHYFIFADNGVGVSDEHLTRLFDLFYRVDSGRARQNGGYGLGLPLVRHIITALGGSISVANQPSGGLSFAFDLPSGY